MIDRHVTHLFRIFDTHAHKQVYCTPYTLEPIVLHQSNQCVTKRRWVKKTELAERRI